MADRDIYIRNEQDNLDKYNSKPSNIPDFLFHYNNFEDFIVLHLSDEEISKWIEICTSKNHFENPMSSNEYVSLFCENIINGYEKGEFPFESFNLDTIKAAIENNKKNILLKSDFLTKLENILKDFL